MQSDDLNEVIGVIGKLNRTIDSQDQQLQVYKNILQKCIEKFGELEIKEITDELGLTLVSQPEVKSEQNGQKKLEEVK